MLSMLFGILKCQLMALFFDWIEEKCIKNI